MATILPFTRPHSPAELLAQILIDQAKLEKLDRLTIGHDLTDEEDAQWKALDDALWENREALRKMIRERCGVSFEQMAEAGL